MQAGERRLKRFLSGDGWELTKRTDHYFYRKQDDDGTLRRTKVVTWQRTDSFSNVARDFEKTAPSNAGYFND